MRLRLIAALVAVLAPPSIHAQRAVITLSPAVAKSPVTGRVFFIAARRETPEPRLQAGSFVASEPFWGKDVSAVAPGTSMTIDRAVLGFPLKSLSDLPPGDYFVQAVLNVYTQVHRADGHTLWVHWDQWEGQRFNRSPGNLVSDVQKVHVAPHAKPTFKLTLNKVLPPVDVPADTKWVRRIRIQSKILTAWWGHPTFIGATVLVPKDFDENPSAKYPAIYIQGHFGLGAPFGFDPDTSKREPAEQRAMRLRRSAREPGFEFAKAWMGDDFPRMVAITFQHPTPYYDDSYAVNSANNGPYADALLQELIPELEKQFRLVPQAGARLLTGGSTGGWECMALQIQHPEFFGGAWCLYPDPVDFRRDQLADIYSDTNAFGPNSSNWKVGERQIMRSEEGQPMVSTRDISQLEAVLGSRERSGEQMNAFDAAWGPTDKDGYPRPLWNKLTGHIDRDVANYWRDQGFDLNYYLKQNWAKVGPSLAGKIHVYVGDMDNHYLNLAVYLMQEYLDTTENPKAEATFEYGRPLKPHGWQPFTNAELVRMMDKYMHVRFATR